MQVKHILEERKLTINNLFTFKVWRKNEPKTDFQAFYFSRNFARFGWYVAGN